MRVAKNLLAATTLLLLFVASYMRLTETVIKARYSTGRRGGTTWHTGYESGNSVFLCAMLTGAVWCLVLWMDRQRS